jgi:hypothetical protein
MRRLLPILALLATGCLPVWATTYYVDNCVVVGSDSNNGTSMSTPWLTIAHVNAQSFNPGDSILFERTCTWREQLVPPSSGSSGSPISFGAYGSGAAPVLNGTSVVTSWTSYGSGIYHASVSWHSNMVFQDGAPLKMQTSLASMSAGSYYYNSGTSTLYVWMTNGSNPSGHTVEASHYPIVTAGPGNGNAGLVDIANKNYVTISGLDIKESNYYGIRLSAANNITVQNSSFEYSYHNAVTADESGVANSANLNVLNSSFSHSGVIRSQGCCEGVAINIRGFQTALVSGNSIDSGYAENIQTDGGANNVTITSNRITNAVNTGIYVSAGYGLGGNTTNVVVSYNNVSMVSGPNPVPYALAIENTYSINGVQMYANIGNCGTVSSPGILFGGSTAPGGLITNVTIANNTIYSCGYGIQALGQAGDASNLFENNILYAYYPWVLADANASYYSPNYDVLYNRGTGTDVIWEGTNYSLAAFQSAKSKMLHSLSADPNFTSPSSGNFTLQGSSPAIHAATNLTSLGIAGLDVDYAGVPRPSSGPWDAGAFVFIQQIPPSPPTALSATVK